MEKTRTVAAQHTQLRPRPPSSLQPPGASTPVRRRSSGTDYLEPPACNRSPHSPSRAYLFSHGVYIRPRTPGVCRNPPVSAVGRPEPQLGKNLERRSGKEEEQKTSAECRTRSAECRREEGRVVQWFEQQQTPSPSRIAQIRVRSLPSRRDISITAQGAGPASRASRAAALGRVHPPDPSPNGTDLIPGVAMRPYPAGTDTRPCSSTSRNDHQWNKSSQNRTGEVFPDFHHPTVLSRTTRVPSEPLVRRQQSIPSDTWERGRAHRTACHCARRHRCPPYSHSLPSNSGLDSGYIKVPPATAAPRVSVCGFSVPLGKMC